MALAQEENIRIPATARIRNVHELKDWLSRGHLPAVVKSGGTFGGSGVAVVRSLADADTAFAAVHARPGLVYTLKRLIVNCDPTLLKQRRDDGCDDTIVQSFVADSHPANRAVACWRGEVLAGDQCAGH